MMKVMMMMMVIMSMMMWKTKSTKMMTLIFCAYTILTSVTMSLNNKLTIIPFILILTILGGLSVLFMYMMSTSNNTQKVTKKNTPMIIPTMITLTLVMEGTSMKLKKGTFDLMDSSATMFNSNNTMFMMLMMMSIMITMISIILKCSTVKLPVRQKLSPWNFK